MNKQFEHVVDETVDQVEVCRICIKSDGKFYVPNEKDGKLTLLNTATRRAISQFARGLADRLMCPSRTHQKKSHRS